MNYDLGFKSQFTSVYHLQQSHSALCFSFSIHATLVSLRKGGAVSVSGKKVWPQYQSWGKEAWPKYQSRKGDVVSLLVSVKKVWPVCESYRRRFALFVNLSEEGLSIGEGGVAYL